MLVSLLFIGLICVNSIFSVALPSSADLDESNKKLSDELLFARFGLGGSRQLFGDRFFEGEDDLDNGEFLQEKRQVKKKWNKFHHGAQSPYTIAFPALIRTRRSTQQ